MPKVLIETKINVKQLQQTAKDILTHPAQFCIDQWFVEPGDDAWYDIADTDACLTTLNPTKNCGTAACINGWVLARNAKKAISLVKKYENSFEPYKTQEYEPREYDTYLSAEAKAGQSLLGLTDGQTHRLFFLENWPEKFQTRYHKAATNRTRAKVAYDRILHFINTLGYE